MVAAFLGWGSVVTAVASPPANPFSTEGKSVLYGGADNGAFSGVPGSTIGSPGLRALNEPSTPRQGAEKLLCGAICTRPFSNNAVVTADSEEPVGYTPTQIRHAYRISDKGGSGQTIAIIATGHDPNAEADLKEYRSHFGLPPCTAANGCFQQLDENGTTSHFPSVSVDSALETAIDLDMASVACQECNLLLVEGNMTTAVDTAAAALGATEISISQADPDAMVSLKANKHFNHPGIPITAASGDYEYRNVGKGANAPSYPATAPGVIAVGGTELTPAPGTPRGWVDNVWASTGSGCSVRMPRPDWQNFISCGTKMTSDVSIVAANIPVYDTYGYKPAEYWHTVEGTSIGAPLIAGIYAHASKMVRDQPGKALYKDLAEGFGSIYDVGPSKTANNTNYKGHSCSPSYLCNAVAGKDGKSLEGYDGPTGVGVPQGVPVLPVWVEHSAPAVPMRGTLRTAPDLDCASTSMCFAVGSEDPYFYAPLAAEWNGYEWNVASTPSENKEFDWLGRLRGVSCPTTDFCMAVGELEQGFVVGPSESYVLRWEGYGWTVDESAPRLNGDDWTGAFSISCASDTDCMIVGGDVSLVSGSLVSAHWDSSGWSTPEISFPSGSEGGWLEKVSCAAEEVENEEEELEESELCLAVGSLWSKTTQSFQTFVERWDGYEWTLDTSVNPPGYQSELFDVSCPSVESCMAVGWMAESPENEGYDEIVPLSEHWNGSEWISGKPPLPGPPEVSGPIGWLSPQEGEEWQAAREAEEEGELYGVSCATPTSCIATGATYGPPYIIEGWNGTSWSYQNTAEMPSGYGLRVDCVTVGSCQLLGAVGAWTFFNSLIEKPDPLVEYGVPNLGPTKATLNASVNPNESEATYQFEYGTTTAYGSLAPATPETIGSGTSSVEVSNEIEGLVPETTYHYRVVATNAEGTTEGPDRTFTTPGWKILSTPNPSGASDTELYDVSCEPGTSACTAVGKGTVSGSDRPVAQRWNGSSWSEQTAAKKSGTLPTRLFGVDCPSETRCLAAGNYQPSEGGPTLVTEIWNESKWSVQTTPVPSEATSSELVAIGCSSTASCTAVGSAVIGGVKTAIAEKWTSPNWALESIPIPEGATSSQLDGVDCIWSNFCVAVGRYTTSGGAVKSFAIYWNGSWSLQTLTAPEGAVETTLLDVSCTKSPSRCMAVGAWKNSEGEQFTLAYRFNGSSTWTLQSTLNPSESLESVFQDVSCATETSCTVAGSQEGFDGSIQTLAEKWNGTSWSIQGTSNPSGAAFSSLFGVSCQSTTCMGVGWSTDGSGVDTTLGEIRDLRQPPTIEPKSAFSPAPSEATLKASIDPNEAETTYQYEYGTTTGYGSKAPATPKAIGSGASPVEVSEKIEGLAPETTYHFRVVATNEKGTVEGEDQTFTTPSWKLLSTPNPSGASDTELYDVSCEPSTSACTAVGKSTKSGTDSPVAQRWNGTSWSEQSVAKKSGTLPTRLFGVDCPSETRCLAAGNYQPSEGGPTLVTEVWNEAKWSVQSPPVPAEATSSELVGIGCNSTAQCRAAGSAVIGGVKTAIIEAWTSPNWTLQSVPIPEGATSSQLDGIDCIWSNVCAAVGRYTSSGGSVKELAMVWNGTTWSLQTLAEPEGAVQTTLLDVSCTPSPTRCTAVGGWRNSKGEQFTLAYRYNGSTWARQSTPNPSGSPESVLQDVSCATETSCTAAGSQFGGGSTRTLAEKWNGTTWSIQGTPNPSGAAFSSLSGVSCRSTTCMGVGWSTDGSGVDTTLGEVRE